MSRAYTFRQAGTEQSRAEPTVMSFTKSQSSHIWQRLVGSPDEKSNWIMINDEIFSSNTALALIMQHAGFQVPHMRASWSPCRAKLEQYVFTHVAAERV